MKGKGLKARQKGKNVEVIAYTDKAVERLQRRYTKMIYRGVQRNKSIARKLACFIFGIKTGNID